VTGSVTSRDQRANADEARRLMAAHAEARDLIEIGAYVAGTNPTVDRAIALRPHLDEFLRQRVEDHCDAATAQQMLASVVGGAA
jgi:flagellum-specific ATP synthase